MKNICVYDTRTNESSVTFRDTEMSVKVKRNLLPVYNFFTYPFQGCRRLVPTLAAIVWYWAVRVETRM